FETLDRGIHAPPSVPRAKTKAFLHRRPATCGGGAHPCAWEAAHGGRAKRWTTSQEPLESFLALLKKTAHRGIALESDGYFVRRAGFRPGSRSGQQVGPGGPVGLVLREPRIP